MRAIRHIFQDTPSMVHINIPEELQHHPVEIIIRLLSEPMESSEQTDENGWPLGFFEATAGCLAEDPIERAPQGEYEQRLELE